MKKTFKNTLILYLLFSYILFNHAVAQKQLIKKHILENELTISTFNSDEYQTLSGLWVNADYIKKLRETRSITKTENNFESFVSMLIADDNSVETLTISQMEPSGGKLDTENKVLFVEDQTYTFTMISKESIRLKKGNTTSNFIKIEGKNDKRTFDGYYYLLSLLISGEYRIVKKDAVKEVVISFKPNNKVTGFFGYTEYYPSSFLENDIVMFDKEVDGNHSNKSFVLKTYEAGFILEEINEFSWDDDKLVYTGKKLRIEKIE